MSIRTANVRYIACACIVCGSILGCADSSPTTRPLTAQEKADEILRQTSSNPDTVDISGGKIGDFDRRAVNRDLDRVFNP